MVALVACLPVLVAAVACWLPAPMEPGLMRYAIKALKPFEIDLSSKSTLAGTHPVSRSVSRGFR